MASKNGKPEQTHPDRLLLPLNELRRYIPVQRSHRALMRWAVDGIRAPDGRVVKLQTVNVANVRHSSVELFAKFLREQNPPNVASDD